MVLERKKKDYAGKNGGKVMMNEKKEMQQKRKVIKEGLKEEIKSKAQIDKH